MAVIPNGAPSLNIKDNVREKYGLEENVFLALFFGTMKFKPNYDAALALYNISYFVASEFQKQCGKKLIFIVAGTDSEELPKTEYFIPLGFVEQLDELLSLPDVVVLPHLPSISGPHVKTIYAFLSRKPVIATEDAIKDMPGLEPNRHFLPFEIDNPEILLKDLIDLYHDENLRENYSMCIFLC